MFLGKGLGGKMESKPTPRKHKYIQKVDEYDQLRWHECVICKRSQECNCNEDTFNKKLKKDREFFTDRLATILLVQTKLLPSSVLGVKDLKSNI